MTESIPTPAERIKHFEDRAFGMFIHWGLYSQLQRGEWTQRLTGIELDEYMKLKDSFTAKDFDADEIVAIAKKAGMKYITLTTRHHEGFSLYDTCGLNDYDAIHSPAKRDLVREFIEACNKEDILPMLYHTTLDWYWRGKKTYDLNDDEFDCYLKYLRDSVEILCTQYGKIGGLWFDGNWSRPDKDWKLSEIYGMIRKHQPEAMIINNTGLECPGKLEHSEIDSVTYENQMASPLDRKGHSKYVAGEMCQTMNSHWGIGEMDISHKSPTELLKALCNSRRCGANYLLNVGPTPDGKIPPLEREILLSLGKWIEIYGEAIYETRPISAKCLGSDFILAKGDKLYYFAHDISISGHENVTLAIGGSGFRQIADFPELEIISAKWLDNDKQLDVVQDIDKHFTAINFSGFDYGWQTVIRVAEIVVKKIKQS